MIKKKENTVKLAWQDSPVWGSFLLVVYAGLALLPLVLATSAEPKSGLDLVDEWGKGVALVGFTLLILQTVLSARLSWIERPFGLDAVMRFHKGMAVFAMGLLLAHPLLLAAGHAGWEVLGLDTSWGVNLGKLGLLILILGVTFALALRRTQMDYNTWRIFHKGMILVPILAIFHSFKVGSDLEYSSLQIYWGLLIAGALILFVYRNIYMPFKGGHLLRVKEIRQESEDVHTLVFEPVDGKPFVYGPGQFWFLRLLRPGRPSEEHPFTLSSSPTGGSLTSTIKSSGNFTNTINQTRVGDRARVEGPFGRFSQAHLPKAEAFIFVAGGIGITPIISTLRYLRDTGDRRPVVLLWGNRTEEDVLFRTELDEMPQHIRNVHVLSRSGETWTGEQGYITADLIKEHTAHLLNRAHLFLCGPPPMLDAVQKELRTLAFDESRLHTENFSL
jgi:predicted ferric reductase